MLCKRVKLIFLGVVILALTAKLFAASAGKIEGVVKDAATGEPLPGANVYLAGTAIGAASDLKGRYRILRVPPGSYDLKVTYIGYKEKTVTVDVLPGKTQKLDLELQFDVVKGETVVITAQAEGQVAAINQQLRSNTIKNIVSAERIMELPDANAAESVGRLPGISILRSGGEANRVVIRGLSPTYNSVTIGGEKIPATDLNDRSVDLNMISPDILAGIEVTKSLTPDMDADAFGGTINFTLADAPSNFRSNFRFQTGYNGQRDEFGQYKGKFTLSNRFWDDKFGLMVTGNHESMQRGSDRFRSSYEVIREKRDDEAFAPISAMSPNLSYVDETRVRSSFNVLMDYRLKNGKIQSSNFMSRLDRNETIYAASYNNFSNYYQPSYRKRVRQIDVLSTSLSGEHSSLLGKLTWSLARTAALTRHPFDRSYTFREEGPFDQAALPEILTADDLINSAKHNLDNTTFFGSALRQEESFERNYMAQVNMQTPFTLTDKIAGYIKFGGKYRDKRRERDRTYLASFAYSMTMNEKIAEHHTRYGDPDFNFRWADSGLPSVYNYLDPNFKIDNFLNGKYTIEPIVDARELEHLFKEFLLDSLSSRSTLADVDDYEVNEAVAAGYIMTEINFGRFLMFMPGVRYENTSTVMTGRKGSVPQDWAAPNLEDPVIRDTTATNTYGLWFPMYHLRLRPVKWFDIRLAYTQTLSRPRLDWMLPKKKVFAYRNLVSFGRPDLRPQVAANYDLFVSFYGNRIGLFTVGGYYKEIEDLIFKREGHKIFNAVEEGFDESLQGFILDRPENNPFLTKVRGWEVEWQTNFRWLPSPLDGIVLNINYSHIWTETTFPRSFVKREKIPTPPFVKTTVVDTFRAGNMPNQSDDIANISIGYDKGAFSARLSMLYQGRTLRSVGERPELDGFTADLFRMDVSVKYRLTKRLGLFLNVNNLTNEPDEAFQMATEYPERYPTSIEYYGMTADLGLGYAF